MRYWLLELPARVVDIWFRVYWFIVTVLAIGCFVTVALTLLLDRFGIRWGW